MQSYACAALALMMLAASTGRAESADKAATADTAKKAFKLYPGAQTYKPPESEANQLFTNTLRPGTTITAYLTEDSFDKVVAFYRRIAKEYAGKKPASAVLPNGAHVRKTFLIFDGAPNLLASTEWIRVQRPFLAKPGDVRDVTEIILTEKVPVPKGKEEGTAPVKAGS